MSNKNEPAYPYDKKDEYGHYIRQQNGLTKRELIAAMAMQGALGGESGSHLRYERLAQDSVAYADALLEALK